MHEANAILAISSTDRFIDYTSRTIIGYKPDPNNPSGPPIPVYQTNANQPVSNALITQYNGFGPFANDFSITAPNALMNGYIDRIIISQIQLQYYLPTIVPKGNDLLVVAVESSPGSSAYNFFRLDLPYGFYSPLELAAMLQIFLNSQVYGNPDIVNFTVSYSQGNVGVESSIGFTILLDDNGKRFFFPTPAYLASPLNYTSLQITSILKTYKTFGFSLSNSLPLPEQNSINTPDFLYTPYIDIYSDALTNYQKLKDSDSSTTKRKGLIARLYLSGVGNPQITANTRNNTYDEDGNLIGYNYSSAALGSQPFVLTFDLNSPKVVGWSSDTAINSLDFQQRDCYGDLLFSAYSTGVPGTTSENFNSEFQMTLLCIEG